MKLARTLFFCLVYITAPFAGAFTTGCGDFDAEPRGCIFEGRYEMGFLAYESPLDCGSSSVSFFGEGEDECSTSIDQLGSSGARQTGYISCDPADPVMECTGYMSDSDGCQWELYIRRISP